MAEDFSAFIGLISSDPASDDVIGEFLELRKTWLEVSPFDLECGLCANTIAV